jgi:hypothetical protein
MNTHESKIARFTALVNDGDRNPTAIQDALSELMRSSSEPVVIDGLVLAASLKLDFGNCLVSVTISNVRGGSEMRWLEVSGSFPRGLNIEIAEGTVKSFIRLSGQSSIVSVKTYSNENQTAYTQLCISGANVKTAIDKIVITRQGTGAYLKELSLEDMRLGELVIEQEASEKASFDVSRCVLSNFTLNAVSDFTFAKFNGCNFIGKVNFDGTTRLESLLIFDSFFDTNQTWSAKDKIVLKTLAFKDISAPDLTFVFDGFEIETLTIVNSDIGYLKFEKCFLTRQALFKGIKSPSSQLGPWIDLGSSTFERLNLEDVICQRLTLGCHPMEMDDKANHPEFCCLSVKSSEIECLSLNGRIIHLLLVDGCKFRQFMAQGVHFLSSFAITNSVFTRAPELQSSKFPSDTTFYKTQFLNEDYESVGAYRFLKKAMGDIGNEVDEATFAAFEIICRSKSLETDEDRIELTLLSCYRELNDIGRKPFRPLVWLYLLWIWSVNVYLLAELGFMKSGSISHAMLAATLNTFLPLKLITPTGSTMPTEHWLSVVMTSTHVFIASVLWYLLITGIRRRFRTH